MSFKFQFDPSGQPLMPTLILASHSGRQKLGPLVAPYSMRCEDLLVEASVFKFSINKDTEPLWDKVTNFKLVYVMEWDTWLQIQVAVIESDQNRKEVTCVGLGKSELSQILVHGLEFNTDDDIARDDYLKAVIFSPDKENYHSILDDLIDKAPHYSLKHVDPSIAKLQKTFTFDDTSVDDALQEIAEECHALVIYDDGMNTETNMPARQISLYDLETVCNECGHRGEFSGECPECGGTDLTYGYGEDTTIFITTDNLTREVALTTNLDSVKNCFKLVAGDDVMTAAIQSCNPNGTDCIWYISDELKSDMTEELRDKINQYDEEYKYYQLEYPISISNGLVQAYNDLVDKYINLKSDLKKIDTNRLIGYPSLMNEMFNIIDFELFLESGLMPVGEEATGTSATQEALKLTSQELSPIGISATYDLSQSIIDTMVLGLARLAVDKRYDVKIKTSQLSNIDTEKRTARWVGTFTVFNPYDEDDTADSDEVTIRINQDYELYIKQRVNKVLKRESDEKSYDAIELLNPETSLEDFKQSIKYYNIATLITIKDSCDTVLDSLMKENAPAGKEYYSNYYNKAQAIINEINDKEAEKAKITAVKDELTNIRTEIQNHLNFEQYLGEESFNEFCTYRRDNIYKNDHYISDGLTNDQLFENAREFFNIAEKEIYKSAMMQHSINATLKDLLVIPQFEPLREHFKLGNWLRILIDGEVYKLRLIKYSLDFSNIMDLDIEFSDVMKGANGFFDIENLLKQMKSMSTSYDTTMRQASKSAEISATVNDWFRNGLDATLTRIVDDSGNQDVVIDNHGILIRDKDPVLDDYWPTQMKFINSILALTTDNWETIKTAIGNFIYQDPFTEEYKDAYGVNAEVVVGSLILGQNLQIYNESADKHAALLFDDDGLQIHNDVNYFRVNPNSNILLSLGRILEDEEEDEGIEQNMLWVDSHGMLHIAGDGAGLDISANDSINGLETNFQVVAGQIRSEIVDTNNSLISYINQTANNINATIQDTQNSLQSSIDQTASSITTIINDQNAGLSSRISQNADQIQMTIASQNNMRAEFLLSLENMRIAFQDVTNGLQSSISQTASQIRAEVVDTSDRLSSSFNQTAAEIRTQLQDSNNNLQSLISQTAAQIRTEVSTADGSLLSSITQQESQIQLLVQQGNDLYSSINQTATQIRTEVADVTERLQSSITQTAGKISLIVEGSSTTGIQITDGAINAFAERFNAKGILTIDAIEDFDDELSDLVDGKFTDHHNVFYTEENESLTPKQEANLSEGDMWYKYTIGTGTGESGNGIPVGEKRISSMNRYNGSTWDPYVAGTTVIGNGVITTELLSADAVTAEKFAGNQLTSLNYKTHNDEQTGAPVVDAGMLISLDYGAMYTPSFSVDTNGYLIAVNGTIGGWKIEEGTLVSNGYHGVKVILAPGQENSGSSSSGSFNVMSVKNTTTSDYPFWLTSDGRLHVNNGDMGGLIFTQESGGYSSIKYGASGIPMTIDSKGVNSLIVKTISTNVINVWVDEDNGDDGIVIHNGDLSVPDGNIKVQGNVISTSDKNLKSDYQPLDTRYEEAFMNIEPVSFLYKNFTSNDHHDRRHYGFLAQDLKSAFNQNGITDEELGFICDMRLDEPNGAKNMHQYGIRYSELISLNTHMIQKTIRENEELKSKIAQLESKIDYLMNR